MWTAILGIIGTAITGVASVWSSSNALDAKKADLQAQIELGNATIEAMDAQKELAQIQLETQKVKLKEAELAAVTQQASDAQKSKNTQLIIIVFLVIMLIAIVVYAKKR